MKMLNNKENTQELSSQEADLIILSKAILKIIAGGSQGCAININPPKERKLLSIFKYNSRSIFNP